MKTHRFTIFFSVIFAALTTVTFMAAAASALIIDSFDQTPFGPATTPITTTQTTVPEALGGQREIIIVSSTVGISGTSPGTLSIVGSRGDVRYGDGNSTAMPVLNADFSSFDRFEIDVQSASGGNIELFLDMYTGGGYPGGKRFNIYPDPVGLIPLSGSPQTVTIPFSVFNDVSDGITPPTSTDLMDVDSIDFRFNTSLSVPATGDFNLVVSEIRAVGGPVPEPSSFALAALGLVGLGWFGIRRRRKG